MSLALEDFLHTARIELKRWVSERKERSEHLFVCPKCGMGSGYGCDAGGHSGLKIEFKKKLHIWCMRCGYFWKEETLDRRGKG
jgi:predicted nucleic-acid-binding Zn-ribbon protein